MKMRFMFEIFLIVFLLFNYNEAGLVHRRSRNLNESPNLPSVVSHLAHNKIPVTVIEVNDSELVSNPAKIDRVIEAKVDASESPFLTEDKITQQTETDELMHQTDLRVKPTGDQVSSDSLQEIPSLSNAKITTVKQFQDQGLLGPEPGLDLRQATAATPLQTSTPQNFVQFIQNSPLGQFINQLTGNQQSLQSQSTGQLPAEEASGPTPTIPGFLNPSVAITSAQQVVQNAAQSVVNTTTQAFQGIQQFATNLGTQFQNTLSNLGGQQNELTTTDSTTIRPPGPLQAIVSNFVGSNNNQAGDAVPPATNQQQQGPLQGLLNFLQGGNRPLNSNTAVSIKPAEQPVTSSNKDPAKVTQVDNKIDDQHDAVQLEVGSPNEIRASDEIAEDSFEVARPDELIVVHDDDNK